MRGANKSPPQIEPVSGRGVNTMGGFGIMILDMMDTLWLMDLKKEFNEGREFVANKDGNGLAIPGEDWMIIYGFGKLEKGYGVVFVYKHIGKNQMVWGSFCLHQHMGRVMRDSFRVQ
jgi:hypothetical protein